MSRPLPRTTAITLFPSGALDSAITVPLIASGALAGTASSAGSSYARKLSLAASPDPDEITCVPAPHPDSTAAKSLPQSRVPLTARSAPFSTICTLPSIPPTISAAFPAARGTSAAA